MTEKVTGITLTDNVENPGGGDPVELSVGCHGFSGGSDTTEVNANTPANDITVKAYCRGISERRALISTLRRAADMIEASITMVVSE